MVRRLSGRVLTERVCWQGSKQMSPLGDRRYEINIGIEYNPILGRKVLRAGRGIPTYISRSEIVVKPEEPIPARDGLMGAKPRITGEYFP